MRIRDGDRLHRALRADRRLIEARVKAPKPAAVAGGAFRKDDDPAPVRERPAHAVRRVQRGIAFAAVQEQRARAFGHAADHRPALDFLLGNEFRIQHRAQARDIEPGDMVGGVQRRFGADPSLDFDTHVENAQDAAVHQRTTASCRRWRTSRPSAVSAINAPSSV